MFLAATYIGVNLQYLPSLKPIIQITTMTFESKVNVTYTNICLRAHDVKSPFIILTEVVHMEQYDF